MRLSDLKKGNCAIVKKIEGNSNIKVRLYDIGLVEGTKIKMLLESPSKQIKGYFFRNTLIAIRDKDAKKIIIGDIND